MINQLSKLTAKTLFEDLECKIGKVMVSEIHHWDESTGTVGDKKEIKLFIHLKPGTKYIELVYETSTGEKQCEHIWLLRSTVVPTVVYFVCSVTNEMTDCIYLYKDRFISKKGVEKLIISGTPAVNVAKAQHSIIEMIEQGELMTGAKH